MCIFSEYSKYIPKVHSQSTFPDILRELPEISYPLSIRFINSPGEEADTSGVSPCRPGYAVLTY